MDWDLLTGELTERESLYTTPECSFSFQNYFSEIWVIATFRVYTGNHDESCTQLMVNGTKCYWN